MHRHTKGVAPSIGDAKSAKIVALCSLNEADLAILQKYVDGISARVSQLSAGLQELSASATEAGSVSLEVAQTADRLAHVANGEGPG